MPYDATKAVDVSKTDDAMKVDDWNDDVTIENDQTQSRSSDIFNWIRRKLGLKTLSSILVLSITCYRYSIFEKLIYLIRHINLRSPEIILINFNEALKNITRKQVQQLWYLPDGHIQLKRMDGQMLQSFVVPGSEMALFDLAMAHVPEFEMRESKWPAAAIIQGVLPFVMLYACWRAFKSIANPSEEHFWQRKKSSKLFFWENFFLSVPPDSNEPAKIIIKFSDVISPVKQEVYEIVEYLKNPKKFLKFGARMPRGVLLVGPAGTGKTMLARAVAAEAGVEFISCSASEFVEIYVGRGARRVREIFRESRESAPSVLFIDELDALGTRGSRNNSQTFSTMEHDEYIQTLNQLLTELDGFHGNDDGVLVMAATNRVQSVDAALLRAGRFDRWIYMDVPKLEDRILILESTARRRGVKLSQNALENLPKIASK